MRRMCTPLLSRKPVAWLWDSFATPWYKNWVKRDSKPSSSSVPVNWNRACLVNHSGAFPEDISASGSEIHTFTLWKPTEWITTTAPFKLLVGFNRRNMLVVLDHQPKQRGNKQDTWDQSLVGLIPRRAEPPAAGDSHQLTPALLDWSSCLCEIPPLPCSEYPFWVNDHASFSFIFYISCWTFTGTPFHQWNKEWPETSTVSLERLNIQFEIWSASRSHRSGIMCVFTRQ